MFMYSHGKHSWMWMNLGDYEWGLGYGNEANSVTGGHCGSWVWVHTRTDKRQPKNKIWRGGTREVSLVTGADRGNVMKGQSPHKNKREESQAKQQEER